MFFHWNFSNEFYWHTSQNHSLYFETDFLAIFKLENLIFLLIYFLLYFRIGLLYYFLIL